MREKNQRLLYYKNNRTTIHPKKRIKPRKKKTRPDELKLNSDTTEQGVLG